jgi:hypothetical protein
MIFLTALLLIFSNLAGADSIQTVDLQFAFKGRVGTVTRAFGLDLRNVRRREVYLLDTLNLDLFHRNLQIRLRVGREHGQIAVKRWGLSQAQFEYLRSTLGNCEIDVHGPVIARSCTAKSKITVDEASSIVSGQSALQSLDDRQISLLTHGQVPMELLRHTVALGPLASMAWSWETDDGRNFNIDFQISPDRRSFKELSVKMNSAGFVEQWLAVQMELHSRGLRLARRQNGRRLEKLTSLLMCERSLDPNSRR